MLADLIAAKCMSARSRSAQASHMIRISGAGAAASILPHTAASRRTALR